MDLKVARKKLGLTQGDVAIKVGVSLVSYQMWERGVTTPKPENMKTLKKVLKLKER